jgi:DNA polymerase I-like protein with 3'-5' exonuclease and polymerase domains
MPDEAIKAVLSTPVIFLDLETTGLSAYRDKIALIQLHDRASNQTLLVQTGYKEPWLVELFQRKDCTFVGHNVSMFDMQFLAEQYGAEIFNLRWFDTLIAESLISTSGRRDVSMSLRASVRRRVGLELDKNIQHGAWDSTVLTQDQVRYAVQDVLALVDLYDAQLSKAAEQGSQAALRLEMEVAPILGRMSWNGLHLPQEDFYKYVRAQELLAGTAEDTLIAAMGKINYNSPKQVISALHRNGIMLDSTNNAVLVDYLAIAQPGPKYDIIKALVDYRAPKKRASMYSTAWYMEHVTGGVVHPLFWSIGADTLRMSSSKPNLQQVPKDARGMFGNVNGLSVVSVDYSQLEIRVAAAISQDQALLDVLNHDDVHTAIAAQIFGIEPDAVNGAQRKAAKAASFTLLFGGSAKTLYDYSRRMGSAMTIEQAEAVFKRFFTTFAGLRATRQKAQAMVIDKRFLTIKLPGGARRVLFGDKLNPQVVLNTTVQATAAIGLKHGLAEARRRGLDVFLGAAVHDELVAMVPAPYAETFGAELSEAMIVGMSNVVNCPITTETKIGRSWT